MQKKYRWPYIGSMEGWESINLGHNHCGYTCPSYLKVSPVSPGQATEVAAEKKAKYSTISTNHWFSLVAIKVIDPINQEGSTFLDEVGYHITVISEAPRARISSPKNLVNLM